MWKSWSSQHDSKLQQRRICGLLNKLNVENFDSMATKLIEWLTSCRRRGDLRTIEAFADSIALRAAEDPHRSSLYAYLCRRVDRELETEDRRWSWLNDRPRQSSHPSFASILIVTFECKFTQALDARAPQLFPLMEFMGDVLLDDVFSTSDVRDLVDQLFALAEQGHEDSAVALSRLCRRVAQEPEGIHILEQLGASGSTERVLEEDIITPRARYLLMAVVDLLHQEPLDVFDSTGLRNEIYNLGEEEEEEEEAEEDLSSEFDTTRTDSSLHSDTTACESEDQPELVRVDDKQ